MVKVIIVNVDRVGAIDGGRTVGIHYKVHDGVTANVKCDRVVTILIADDAKIIIAEGLA